jgi:hypothetical protein
VTIVDEAAALADELADLRHAIHAEPEIGLDLPKTQAKVLAALAGLPLEISAGTSLSSVTAVLRGNGERKSVLLRGDMDALPITELTGLPPRLRCTRGRWRHRPPLSGSMAPTTSALKGGYVGLLGADGLCGLAEGGQLGSGEVALNDALDAAIPDLSLDAQIDI